METCLWIRLVLGGALGATAVSMSNFIVRYKVGKNPSLVKRPFNTVLMGILSVLLCSFSTVYIGGRISLVQELITAVFVYFVCVGTIVDNRIRIIANEMVALIAGMGIIYRISYGDPLGQLLNSLLAVAFMVVLLLISLKIGQWLKLSSLMLGAGDFKLLLAVALVSGYPGVQTALLNMAVALLVFITAGIVTKRLTLYSTFPMAGFIFFGLWTFLLQIDLLSAALQILG